MTNEELRQVISQQIPGAVFEESQFLNAVIDGGSAFGLLKSLRENPETEFDYLFCESGVDWKEFFYVVYHLASRRHRHTVVVKAKIIKMDQAEKKIGLSIKEVQMEEERRMIESYKSSDKVTLLDLAGGELIKPLDKDN